MATTHYLISKVTVGSGGAANIDITNIPQTYTDLFLVYSSNTDGGGVGNIFGSFNNDTGSNYSEKVLANDPTAKSYSRSGTYIRYFYTHGSGQTTTNAFASGNLYIPNYTSSNYKSVTIDAAVPDNSSSAGFGLNASLWSSTAAINRITLYVSGYNFSQYSTFSLYGVSSSGDSTKVPYASGGDVITTDGTYWIHTFKSSGTFTPLKNLTADYLVVAGGAGGGSYEGGGGGAGGLRSTVTATGGGGSLESALSLTANTGYTVTVGAGGNGSTLITNNGSNGSNSVFSTITATGGGGGGSDAPATGSTGGSGGGSTETRTGAAGTANQGYAGGNGSNNTGYNDYYECGGGGGGAGAVGSNGSATAGSGNGGNGGVGVATSISGSSTYYAGGGGGGRGVNLTGSAGTGGNGGGGNGNTGVGAGSAGTANTGGGGGGAGAASTIYAGGNGGSGIVIVRYPV